MRDGQRCRPARIAKSWRAGPRCPEPARASCASGASAHSLRIRRSAEVRDEHKEKHQQRKAQAALGRRTPRRAAPPRTAQGGWVGPRPLVAPSQMDFEVSVFKSTRRHELFCKSSLGQNLGTSTKFKGISLIPSRRGCILPCCRGVQGPNHHPTIANSRSRLLLFFSVFIQ